MSSVARAPFRPVPFIARDIELERRADGVLIVRNRIPLRPYEQHLPAVFRRQAALHPDRLWLAQRRGPERAWRRIAYGEGLARVNSLTQALLGLGAEGRTVLALSGNSIEHALLGLAAQQARMPFAAITPAYSLLSEDHAKLKTMAELLKPAVIFVQNARAFERALHTLKQFGAAIIHADDPVPGLPSLDWNDLAETPAGAEVDESIGAITPDTVAKYIFTSGSTGAPKAVITTQRMLTSNLAMLLQLIDRPLDDEPTLLLDCLPWSHVMASSEFNRIIGEGGELYIDDGRPSPGQFDETIANLKEVSPTRFANVPVGYAMLADALEQDVDLARTFFRRLQTLAYGGASLPDPLYARLQALALRHTGFRIPFVSGFGATETGPCALFVFWPAERVGLIGLPHPGVELKLVPLDETRFEVRIRSDSVTPGYLGQPEASAAAFDEEGYYRLGDTASFADPGDPREGLAFCGRLTEEFKLTSGTFVRVGVVRSKVLSATQPLLSDIVVAGPHRDYVAILAWPNSKACREALDDPKADASAIMRSPRLRVALLEMLKRYNAANTGGSMRIRRLLLLSDPPSLDAGEVTDKGYVNQRRALEARAADLEKLYAERPGEDVIVVA